MSTFSRKEIREQYQRNPIFWRKCLWVCYFLSWRPERRRDDTPNVPSLTVIKPEDRLWLVMMKTVKVVMMPEELHDGEDDDANGEEDGEEDPVEEVEEPKIGPAIHH